MTVITAIRDKDQNCVWIGGNNRATLGALAGPPTDEKWATLGPWLIGVTGTGPKNEALEAAKTDAPKVGDAPLDVVKLMKKAYDAFDIGETDDGVKRYCGGGVLVHKNGAVWDFDDSFCLTAIPDGVFWARGSGMDMAIGAGRALEKIVPSKKELTTRVIEIVVANDTDCPGEPVVRKFDASGRLTAAD